MSNDKKVPCEVWSRVVGYFQPISQWNKGKQEEFKDRKNYDLGNKSAQAVRSEIQ